MLELRLREARLYSQRDRLERRYCQEEVYGISTIVSQLGLLMFRSWQYGRLT